MRDNLSTQMNCEEVNYPSSLLREFSDNELDFTLKIPKSWVSKTTNDGTDKMVKFQDTLHTADFETLYLTQTSVPSKFNLKDEFDTIFKPRIPDTNVNVNNGECVIDGLKGKWLMYDNFSFQSNNLNVKDLYVLISSNKNYYSILASVYGNDEVEERMCKMINMLYTFEER